MIRYWDEEVELGHVVQFRSELDVVPGSEKTAYYLEVELLFVEIAAVGGPDFALSLFTLEGPNALDLRPVSSRTFKLTGPSNDVFSGYIPGVFDEMHYSVLHATIHSTILEYRLRQLPLELQSPEANETEEEPVLRIVPLAAPLAAPTAALPEEKLQPVEAVSRKIDMSQYLFGDLEGNLPKLLSASEADEAYDDYVAVLSREYEKLVSKLTDLGQRALSEADSKKMSSDLQEGKENLFGIKKLGFAGKGTKKAKFSEKCKQLTPQEVTKELTQELNILSGNILQAWYKYIEILKSFPKRIVKSLLDDYNRMLNETFGYFAFQSKIEISGKMKYKNFAEQHKQQVKALHAGNFFDTFQALPVQDQSIFGKIEDIPLLFEDISCCNDKKEAKGVLPKVTKEISPKYGQHLIVLVHGFQASAYDMRLIKNNLALLYPGAYFLCSTENERKTDCDIKVMGINLAEEVKTFIIKNGLVRLTKMSFIGHSLGGVIIRAALEHLEEYKGKMYTFLTLSSPHLGYLFHSSSLVNAGMWFIKTWQKSKCLEQLSFSDHADLSQCYLYRLAHTKVKLPRFAV